MAGRNKGCCCCRDFFTVEGGQLALGLHKYRITGEWPDGEVIDEPGQIPFINGGLGIDYFNKILFFFSTASQTGAAARQFQRCDFDLQNRRILFPWTGAANAVPARDFVAHHKHNRIYYTILKSQDTSDPENQVNTNAVRWASYDGLFDEEITTEIGERAQIASSSIFVVYDHASEQVFYLMNQAEWDGVTTNSFCRVFKCDAEDGSNKSTIYSEGGPSGPATRTGLSITFSQRHRQVLILEAEPNAVGAPRRIKRMDLDGGNVQTLFEIDPTTVIGGFAGWSGPVGNIQYCEKTDRVYFIISRSATADMRRLCSVNYANLDLQFHASGDKSFGLTPPGFRMGCGFEATGGAYTG